MENIELDLLELLSDSEREHFESLAPSYRKIFVHHALKSNVEKTRLKNIDEVKEAMELKCKNMGEYKCKISNEVPVDENLSDIEKVKLYFDQVGNSNAQHIVEELYNWLITLDDNLMPLYAWNKPMIKYNETFICGVTVAKQHMTLAFETQVQDMFKDQIIASGYGLNLKTFKIKYNQEINYELLTEMVMYSIKLKKSITTFWL